MEYENKYYYKCYGLYIESQFLIPEFIKYKECKNDVQVMIKNGIIPKEIKNNIGNKNEIRVISKSYTWFHINGVATYMVENGNKVTVEICENADEQMVRLYLMCSCLGFIMIQRDMVAIHGGTIVIDDRAVLFTGDRGAGKSTITSALRNNGYKFIADDVASTYIDEKPFVVHGFPYQKLCEDALLKLGYDKSKYESFMGDERKYLIPAYDSFVEKDTQLDVIFELAVGNVEFINIEEIKGAEKLTKIIKNIYRIEYIEKMGGVTPMIFKQCLEIAKHIKFYKITRPRNGFTVDKQIEIVESILNSNKEEKVV